MVHQWKMTAHTHSSLDFKSQRWRSCIWLWAKTWKNEFMLGLVCFCYLLIRKIPVLFLMQRLCICIIYFTPIASLDFIWKINTETSITFFFFCLFTFLFFLPIVSYAQTMNMLMHVCRYVRWQSGGREQLAGPHSTTYWPVLHSPVIQPNLSTWLCCSWATINLAVRAREGSLE